MRVKGRSLTEVTGPLGLSANVNSSGHLQVSIEQDNAGVGGGIQYTEADVDATVTGQALMFESDSTANTLAVVNRDVTPLPVAIVEGTAAGSTQVSIRNFQTSSGASMEDSTQGSVKVTIVEGSAAGSTQVSVSSGAVRVYQSTAGDLNVTVAGYVAPTTGPFQMSSLAGRVAVSPNSTAFASSAGFHFDSSGALQVNQESTIWAVQLSNYSTTATVNLRDGSGNALVSSTNNPSTNERGLVVRSALPQLSWYAASTVGESTSTPIVSSNASKVRVYAYSITSTLTTANTLSFRDGDGGTLLWPVHLQAVSSAMTGANLAVTPPAYLFAASSDTALVLNIASSGRHYHVGVSYFLEP